MDRRREMGGFKICGMHVDLHQMCADRATKANSRNAGVPGVEDVIHYALRELAEKGKEKEKDKEKEKEKGRDRPREKFINVTKEDLWALQRVLVSRKSSLSSTYKKNSGANNKLYDLNQRTVAALDRLAEVCETFEDTWDIVEKESAEGDMLFATEEDSIDKMEAARQHQDRTLEVFEDCRQSLDGVLGEFSNCRALHEAAWIDVQEASRRHSELKRKAAEAHERTILQRECLRRATRDHVKAEEVLNNSVGCLSTLVKDTAGATHALTCGVLDRESNETR